MSDRGALSLGVIVVVLVCLVGCGETDDGEGRHSLDLSAASRHEPQHIRTPSLASVSESSGNLLSPDPSPMMPPEAVRGGELRRGEEYISLRHVWVTEVVVTVTRINGYVVEPLARRHMDDPTQWAGVVARSIERTEDGLVYTVHLKPGVRWHAPFEHSELPDWLRSRPAPELTASDFEFAFEMLKNPAVVSAAPVRSWYADCRRLEVVDRYTFKMHWDVAGLGAEMWTMMFAPLPAHIYKYDKNQNPLSDPARELETHWYRWPMGTGPYRLVMEGMVPLQTGDMVTGLTLDHNPAYHDVLPPIARVRFEYVDGENALAWLADGELDAVELTPALYRKLVLESDASSPVRRGEVGVHLMDKYSYFYIGWNLDAGRPTSDRKVRQALTMLINREWLVDEVLSGLARVPSGPYDSSTPFAAPDVSPFPFDPRRAAQLLEEAGWVDVDGDGIRERGYDRLVITVSAGGGRTPSSMLPALRRWEVDAAAAGVELRFVMENRPADQPLSDGWIGGWGHDWEDDLFQIFHSSQAHVPQGSNLTGYQSVEADALIETIRSTSDAGERLELHHALHRLLHEDQPYTFLMEETAAWAISGRVRGVEFQYNQPRDLSFGWWLTRGR